MKKPILLLTVSLRRLLMIGCSALLLVLGLLWQGERQTLSVINLSGASVSEQHVREQVERLAKQYNAEPIDAKKDPVWKAIPGVNGINVDVEASVKKILASEGQQSVPLVVKQVQPKISLKELGALPIYRGNSEKKQMALMINVAWGTEYIQGILALLDEHKVKATFFLDGSWVAKNPQVAKEILQRGHELGNHAYSHPDLAKMDASQTSREIIRTNEAIKRATGTVPTLFAPPSGSYSSTTVQVAHGQGMKTILWTLDTVDWKKPPASAIESRVLSKAENGALVLMHPTEPTQTALRRILPGLLQKGYALITVSQLLDPTRPIPMYSK